MSPTFALPGAMGYLSLCLSKSRVSLYTIPPKGLTSDNPMVHTNRRTGNRPCCLYLFPSFPFPSYPFSFPKSLFVFDVRQLTVLCSSYLPSFLRSLLPSFPYLSFFFSLLSFCHCFLLFIFLFFFISLSLSP